MAIGGNDHLNNGMIKEGLPSITLNNNYVNPNGNNQNDNNNTN